MEKLFVQSRDEPLPGYAEVSALETVTLISAGGVSDEIYSQVREHFDEKQFVALIMAINVINSWNRLAISTGMTAPAEW